MVLRERLQSKLIKIVQELIISKTHFNAVISFVASTPLITAMVYDFSLHLS